MFFSLLKNKRRQKGFTLIEMLVSTALFIIVAMVITGALMMVIQSYRKVQSAKIAMDNLSFAMDNMILRLRDGSNYEGDTGVSSYINFTDSAGLPVRFQFNTASSSLQKCAADGSDCITLTSPEAKITDLRFYIRQNSDSDLARSRPLVVIFIRGVAGKPGDSQTSFAFQTTVSQRNARPASP